jgi:hypothetical protein
LKIFLSSTFRDLANERKAVLGVLQRKRQAPVAMEYFLAKPTTPLKTALEHLRKSDVVILLLGFRSGSLISDGTDRSYTEAEYDEATKLQLDVLPFLKKRKVPGSKEVRWVNQERSAAKKRALNRLKRKAGPRQTWRTFTNPDQLATAVLEALDDWEDQGRPGARKTFSSAPDFFDKNAPQFKSPILDLSTTLLGRDNEIAVLNEFLNNPDRSVGVLTGRGGIGKSKLLRDWIRGIADRKVVLLRYSPFWDSDSHKEIPVGSVLIVVDDAHRSEISEALNHTIQLFRELRNRQDVKLILSARPGTTSGILRDLRRSISEAEIREFDELKELTETQAEALAKDVLGPRHQDLAKDLAVIAGNSPLVIVAGGKLLATGEVNPAKLKSNKQFKTAVFDRFIAELQLVGPDFPISPTRPVLDLIAALGPVDVNSELFLAGAERFLSATRDQILRTIDALAARGIVSRPDQGIRILPDVLSDFVMEGACATSQGRPTGYADRVYKVFGDFFFGNLMKNLSELDWRIGKEQNALSLLDKIWQHIEQSFIAADGTDRHRTLEQLAPAAFFQPKKILQLVKVAMETPVVPNPAGSRYQVRQDYVISAIPRLLEATAYHPEHISESIDLLWQLSRQDAQHGHWGTTAREVLKRLASYQMNRWVAFNFAMLLQCIRLSTLEGALDAPFTPFDLIDVLLESEGEFTELSGNTVRFGGFALNYPAVGPVRKNALQFLKFLLSSPEDGKAVRAARTLGWLLHEYLTRVGRQRSPEEVAWQNKERCRSLAILTARIRKSPLSLPVQSEIYDAIRSGTGINCPEAIRVAAQTALTTVNRTPDLIVFDSLSRREGDLPILKADKDNPAGSWMEQIETLTKDAHSALAELNPTDRAKKLVDFARLADHARIETRGFDRLVRSFHEDVEFLEAIADQLLAPAQSGKFIQQLASALDALHAFAPTEFRGRAWKILEGENIAIVRAAATALRVYTDTATREDVALIKRFLQIPDSFTKRSSLHAIAYMGKNRALLEDLLDAALSVDVGLDVHVADGLADVFGRYGVPIRLLTAEQTSHLLKKFLAFEDLDFQQGSVPRFLSHLNENYPEQVLTFLIERTEEEERRRTAHDWNFQALPSNHHAISFGSADKELAPVLLKRSIAVYFQSNLSSDTSSELFWSIDPMAEHAIEVIADEMADARNDRIKKTLQLLGSDPRGINHALTELSRIVKEFPARSKKGKNILTLIGAANNAQSEAGATE